LELDHPPITFAPTERPSRQFRSAVALESNELEAFNDLIQSIEEIAPGSSEEIAPRIHGAASWHGSMTGPLRGPTFSGHARGERIAYGKLHVDSVEGDMTYSPSELSVSRGHLKYGAMQSDFEGTLDLDH
jgi:hypothetical protein